MKPCPADRPLGGHVVEDLRSHTLRYDCRGTAELWFDLVPFSSSTWPGSLYGAHVASAIVYRLQIHGCSSVSARDGCTAPSMSASGTVRSAGPLDRLGLSFDPLEPTLRFETLPDEIESRLTTPITCRNGSDSWGIRPSNGIRPHAEGDLGVQRGFLQVAVDSSAALRRELRPRLERFQHEKHQAEQYRNDFDYVSNSCAGWDVAVTLTEALFGGVGAAEGLGPTEGAKAFSKLLSIIQAVLEQDPTIPLTAFLGAAEELEVAGQSALEVTLLGIEGFTTSGVIDTVGSITNGALEFLQAGEVQAQRERLEECTDTPLVAGVTFDGAREYLNHAEAAARELSATLPLMTRLEQSDTNIYNAWAAYHQACLQYAGCKGLDPAVCNPPPP